MEEAQVVFCPVALVAECKRSVELGATRSIPEVVAGRRLVGEEVDRGMFLLGVGIGVCELEVDVHIPVEQGSRHSPEAVDRGKAEMEVDRRTVEAEAGTSMFEEGVYRDVAVVVGKMRLVFHLDIGSWDSRLPLELPAHY
jgi:hypothetical protein